MHHLIEYTSTKSTIILDGKTRKNYNEPKRNMTLFFFKTFVSSYKYSAVQFHFKACGQRQVEPLKPEPLSWGVCARSVRMWRICQCLLAHSSCSRPAQTKRARAACLKLFQTVEEIRKSPRIPAGRERALWSPSDRVSVRTLRWCHTSSTDTLYALSLSIHIERELLVGAPFSRFCGELYLKTQTWL